ncbi:hypothetical protein BN1088_680001 [Sphingobacterium sp. PM2-P1-29]|nr:hypothetical protein BN1088_680001 [Sphingobacterium sp. PM2-P1-29]
MFKITSFKCRDLKQKHFKIFIFSNSKDNNVDFLIQQPSAFSIWV